MKAGTTVELLEAFREGATDLPLDVVDRLAGFVRLRRLMATPGELAEQIMKLAETVQLHDERIKAIAAVLREMMEQPADPPKGRIGFQSPTPRH